MKKAPTPAEVTAAIRKAAAIQMDAAGVWAVEASQSNFMATARASVDIAAHLQRGTWFDEPVAEDYVENRDGVAVVHITGLLLKRVLWFGSATPTTLIRQAIRGAAQDSSVKSILLSIESPGGTAAGTKELADEISAAKAHKPVHAHITDLGASAAYWVASQASRLTANEMAIVGSIGTYQVVHDVSAAAEAAGVKVHVIKAGDFKGIGTPGVKITEPQLAYLSDLVEQVNSAFVQGVAAGRRLPAARSKDWADGKAHMAAQAKALGLIDAVESYESAFEAASKAGGGRVAPASNSTSRPPRTEVRAMTQTTTPAATQTATQRYWDAVKAQQAKGMDRAKAMQAVNRQHPSLRQAMVAEANARPEPPESPGQSAYRQWQDAVKAEEAKGLSRVKAIAAVDRSNPGLRQSMLAEVNGR